MNHTANLHVQLRWTRFHLLYRKTTFNNGPYRPTGGEKIKQRMALASEDAFAFEDDTPL